MVKNILFIAAHPDDETLGCGGAIQKHKEAGDSIYWLIITKAYEEDGFNSIEIKEREDEIIKVSKEFRFDKTFTLNLHAIKLDSYPIKDVIANIAKVIKDIDANVLFIPNKTDVHSDHFVTFNAAWSCSKSFRFPSVKEVYIYETVSETEFTAPLPGNSFMPNTFYDITPYLKKKNEIAEIYKSEIAAHPFPRSTKNIEALATLRGAQIGVNYAEAFVCLKRIIDL